MGRPFLKMNGLGNDFVVVEAREGAFTPGAADAMPPGFATPSGR